MTFQTLSSLSNSKVTPQTLPAGNAPVLQVKNNAGGYVFQLSPEKQLDRFLIIGTSGGTYYQSERSLLKQNLDGIKALIKTNGKYVVDRLVQISDAGRARNNDYALLVLALCLAHGNNETKALARTALPLVARTGTHLMHFAEFAQGQRGWGSALKKAVANWFQSKDVADVAYQALKYQSRDGWSQRDLLRLSHPKTKDPLRQNVYRYITKGAESIENGVDLPAIVQGFELAKEATDTKTVVKLIQDYNLSMEMIPTESRNDVKVWEALLPRMGATAVIRNLNKMTAVGLIGPFTEAMKFVVGKLTDKAWLKKARIHPLQLLVAQKIYSQGRGDKGSLTWTPVQAITKALEDAFYLSFDTIEPSGKNRFMAIDVSGSMNSACNGAPQLSCREAAAVLAMVSVRVEPWSVIYGFDHSFRDLKINKNDSLRSVCEKTYSHRFGSTDCSLPMVYARQQKWDVDQFEVYTDNETYFGSIHPFQAMQQYRKAMEKPNATLAVLGMTASNFSIADPTDAGMLDLVGFDTATPSILADLAAGRL